MVWFPRPAQADFGQDVNAALRAALATLQDPNDDDGAPEAKPERQWITHEIVPGERYEDIGARYGVSKTEIIRWNKKRLGEKKWLFSGRKLRIYARVVPPPRERITYEVQHKDTLDKIARQFNVTTAALRYWNKKTASRLRTGAKLTVWTNPAPETRSSRRRSRATDSVRVRPGGYAVGKPNRGRLRNGVQLPKSDLYTIRKPEQAWGTSKMILLTQTAIAEFRSETGYEGELAIGAISLRNGGRFRPHSSHQTGRDIDIWLPRRPEARLVKSPGPQHIDWRVAWGLVHAFLDTGEVEFIFLSYRQQRLLYRAAQSLGARQKELDRIFQYPRGPRSNHGVIRDADGHVIHVHIRIKCAREATQCRTY